MTLLPDITGWELFIWSALLILVIAFFKHIWTLEKSKEPKLKIIWDEGETYDNFIIETEKHGVKGSRIVRVSLLNDSDIQVKEARLYLEDILDRDHAFKHINLKERYDGHPLVNKDHEKSFPINPGDRRDFDIAYREEMQGEEESSPIYLCYARNSSHGGDLSPMLPEGKYTLELFATADKGRGIKRRFELIVDIGTRRMTLKPISENIPV